jgi:multidrug efflux pump subunit AcrA (membrane-fusion protein)
VTAEVFFEDDRALRIPGVLVFVASQIDPTTGTLPIKVRLSDTPLTLLSGQGVKLRLLLGFEPNASVVPEAALQHAQQGAYVYVVRDGKAEVQPVRPLRSLDGEYMVVGELRAGEPVLIEIPQRLKSGSKVRLEGGEPEGKEGKVQP